MDDIFCLEPVTRLNLPELKPGDWIWDSRTVKRKAHKKSIYLEEIEEPIGFRQIHIMELGLYPRYSNTPFMLSSVDGGRPVWECFSGGRYFRFKKVNPPEPVVKIVYTTCKKSKRKKTVQNKQIEKGAYKPRSTPLDDYRREKIHMLKSHFCINLSSADMQHFFDLDNEIAIDQYAHTLIVERL